MDQSSIFSKSKKPLFQRIRQESEGQREHDELNIIMDSDASEHVVAIASYLSSMEKLLTMSVVLANGTKVKGTHKGIVRVDVEVNKLIPCRAYFIHTLKFKIIPCSRRDKFGVKAR